MGGRTSVRIMVVASLVVLFVAPDVAAPARVLEIPRTLARTTSLEHDVTERLGFAATHIAFTWWGDEGTGVLYRVLDRSGRWSVWRTAPEDHDMEHEGRHYSAMISVDRVVAIEHQTVRPAGSRMGDVSLSYLNTLDGPTTTVRLPAVANAAAEVPVVVTRAEWDADESIRNKRSSCREFFPLQQLLVHHTAGRNFDPDPYGTMRAIAWYHTVQRGWCDIGYNFVIAPDGTVFEGRFARVYGPWEVHSSEKPTGEALAGAHASSYNSGSLGISMMGNYSQVPLPLEARDSLVNFLAWVADRHDLDPLSRYKYVNPVTGAARWLPRIAGHRTVGSTECPGDFLKFKQLRHSVALTVGEGKIVPDLSLAASTTTVSPGQSVTLSGSLVDANGSVAGAPIVVYQRPKGGRWSLAGQTTTSVDGTYALRVAPTMTTRYRAVYNGDAERWAAQSLLANVRVLQPSPSPTTR